MPLMMMFESAGSRFAPTKPVGLVRETSHPAAHIAYALFGRTNRSIKERLTPNSGPPS
jgi:hypothetical protein